MNGAAGERRTASAGGPLVFQIGFHRCGTTALAAFFERCGLPCVHYDSGRLGRRLRENLAAGRAPLAGYEGCRAFTNMQYEDGADYFDGMAHFRALDAAYDARFVLNTRPLEHWLRSLAVHYARRPLGAQCLEARFGTADPTAVAEGWRAAARRNTTGACARNCRPGACWCSTSSPTRRNGCATSSARRRRWPATTGSRTRR